MAWYRPSGGGANIKPVLIGDYSSQTTATVTRTLNESISDYKYLWFSLAAIVSDTVWYASSNTDTGYAFCDIDYFRNNPVVLRYGAGSSGTGNFYTMTMTYVNDTTFTSKATSTNGRHIYVYGIK